MILHFEGCGPASRFRYSAIPILRLPCVLRNLRATLSTAGKADVVDAMLADTFTSTDRETYGKSRLLSNLKGGKWDVNGISDVKGEGLRRHRVATGSWRGKGMDGDGYAHGPH